jgi:hypothetical protein
MSALNHIISSDRLSTSGWSQRTLNLPESLTFLRPIEVELDLFHNEIALIFPLEVSRHSN